MRGREHRCVANGELRSLCSRRATRVVSLSSRTSVGRFRNELRQRAAFVCLPVDGVVIGGFVLGVFGDAELFDYEPF